MIFCPRCRAEMHETIQETPGGPVTQGYCLTDGFLLHSTELPKPEPKIKQWLKVDWDTIHKLANE